MSRMLALLAERLTADELAAVQERAEELLAGYVQPDGTLAVPSLARVALARPDKRREEWRGPDLNRRHHGFQPCALPTELPRLGG